MGTPSAQPRLPALLRVKRFWLARNTRSQIRTARCLVNQLGNISRSEMAPFRALSEAAKRHPERFTEADFSDAIRQIEGLTARVQALTGEVLGLLHRVAQRWDALNAEAQRWQLHHLLTPAAPPRAAELLLCLLLPPKGMEEILGDLSETYHYVRSQHGAAFAGFWYYAQAAKSARATASAAMIAWLLRHFGH